MYPVIPMPVFLILFIVSMVFCCIGFKRFIWFISVGYGLSAAGIGAAMFVMALIRGGSSVIFLIQCLLFVVYGVRLGGFLLARELKNAGYKAKMNEIGVNAKTPIFVSVFMWLYCGAIYLCQAGAACYRFANGFDAAPNAALYIGVAVSAIGIVLEAIADKQKSAQKAKNPKMPAMEGLFKMCRCPNYFGEILFWTGIIISGIGGVKGAQWIIAILGYVEIVGVMFSGAKRLETRHIKNYGSDPAYNAYADKTPILIPLLPIYHMTSAEAIARDEAKKAAKKAAGKAKK